MIKFSVRCGITIAETEVENFRRKLFGKFFFIPLHRFLQLYVIFERFLYGFKHSFSFGYQSR